jgi:hypothetical protein
VGMLAWVALWVWACLEQTTPLSQQSARFVTVTHPHHPLYGQEVKVIRLRRGADPDLVIRHPDGFHTAIAMSCTDYAASSPSPHDGFPPSLLDYAGLCQLAEFIEDLRQSGRFPTGGSDRDTRQVSYD